MLNLMRCPHDENELELKEYEGFKINFCKSCQGFQVSLHQEKARELKELIVENFQSALLPQIAWKLRSPSSTSLMKRFCLKGTELDYCEQSNSVWFDFGEYNKISSYLSLTKKGCSANVSGISREENDDASGAFAFLQTFYGSDSSDVFLADL